MTNTKAKNYWREVGIMVLILIGSCVFTATIAFTVFLMSIGSLFWVLPAGAILALLVFGIPYFLMDKTE